MVDHLGGGEGEDRKLSALLECLLKVVGSDGWAVVQCGGEVLEDFSCCPGDGAEAVGVTVLLLDMLVGVDRLVFEGADELGVGGA